MRQIFWVFIVFVSCMSLSACGAGQIFRPTGTPMPTITDTPPPTSTLTSTLTPTLTPTATITLTPTPVGGGTGQLVFVWNETWSTNSGYSSLFPQLSRVTNLFVSNWDGTDLTPITDNGLNGGVFASILDTSPDGSKILVSSHYGQEQYPNFGDLFLVHISTPAGESTSPKIGRYVRQAKWVDNSKFIFSASINGEQGLYLIDSEDLQSKPFKIASYSDKFAILDDGRIVFAGLLNGEAHYLYRVNMDGTNLKRIAELEAGEYVYEIINTSSKGLFWASLSIQFNAEICFWYSDLNGNLPTLLGCSYDRSDKIMNPIITTGPIDELEVSQDGGLLLWHSINENKIFLAPSTYIDNPQENIPTVIQLPLVDYYAETYAYPLPDFSMIIFIRNELFHRSGAYHSSCFLYITDNKLQTCPDPPTIKDGLSEEFSRVYWSADQKLVLFLDEVLNKKINTYVGNAVRILDPDTMTYLSVLPNSIPATIWDIKFLGK
jgi:hypothetical protein